MKFIKHEDIPRWYHLFWDREKEGLYIKISKFFLKNCKDKDFEPYFRGLYDKPSFLPLFDKYETRLGQQFFGINDSISLVAQDEEWMAYQIKIPTFVHYSNFVCRSCGGTGKRQLEHCYNEECGRCRGNKTEKLPDHIKIDEVCYSLSVFLHALWFPIEEGDVNTPYKQLFTITSFSKVGSQGHSVGGYCSPEFLRFLESYSTSYDNEVILPSVTEVMMKVHRIMYGEVEIFDRFACLTRGGQIILDCPGNACQIHFDSGREVGSGRGNNITCHNLDTGMQQLMLLAGLGGIASLYNDWEGC